MKDTTLYVHITPNNKYYIGITQKLPKKRWGNNGEGYRGQRLFWRAIQKYGWDNIQHLILLENLDREVACECERYLIAKYNTSNSEYGYNVSYGGDVVQLGLLRTDLQKQHISDGHKGLPLTDAQIDNLKQIHENAKGKHLSEEHKKKISDATKGKKRNDESRKRMSESRKGKSPWNKGKSMSEETKEKLRQANLGKHPSEETRKKISKSNKGKRLGIVISDETKRKISESNKGRVAPNKGKHMSDASKKKLSESIKKAYSTKDVSGVNNGFYGKHHTPETIERIRQASLRRANRSREEKFNGNQ